ncbi:hypothetical protein A9Q84_02870 [Halobacteriovorax marinus]|uniref:Hemerythrin-like domain-containing protein n=1 Tax=Halobacteriovorax marinus TaxID=97084 RepID=A0A1Y5FCQ9_9BACT|nr:hypothetical protein A9Q84_02870 [Halobacteriovorax marinus]
MDWNEDLEVEVDFMNDEHKVILSLMNNLYVIFKRDPQCVEFSETFFTLRSYTEKHFKDEERFMQEMNYSGFESHRVIHQKILEMFSKHVEYYNEEGEVEEGFFDFLTYWLHSHMNSCDSDYSKEYHQQQMQTQKNKLKVA